MRSSQPAGRRPPVVVSRMIRVMEDFLRADVDADAEDGEAQA